MNAMVVTPQIRDLVLRAEDALSSSFEAGASAFRDLYRALSDRLASHSVRRRFDSHAGDSQVSTLEICKYPIKNDGYAVGFDPLEEEAAFWDCWSTYGVVVAKAVVDPSLCRVAVERIAEILWELSGGQFSLQEPETYMYTPTDPDGMPIISRGFCEIYHDQIWAQLRQSLRLYLHHVLVHGTTTLWTSFDRSGVKLPLSCDAQGLPLHVDQNPSIYPSFTTTQGVLALADCPVERGTYIGVPGSKALFKQYESCLDVRRNSLGGQYVQLGPEHPSHTTLQDHAQTFPLRLGELVTWDSRTTHSNGTNTSLEYRAVAYISAGPAREADRDAVLARRTAFSSGLGENVRSALMHASRPPRYPNSTALKETRHPEQFTHLGRLLYGLDRYADLSKA